MFLFIDVGSLWLMLIENQSEKLKLSLLCSQFEFLTEYRMIDNRKLLNNASTNQEMLLFIEGGSLQLWLMLIENQSEKRLSLLCSQFELLIEYRIQGLFVDCCLVKLSSTGSKLRLWKQRKLHKWIAQPCRKKEMRQVHSFCVYLSSGNEAVVIMWTINSKQSSSSRDNSPTTEFCNT